MVGLSELEGRALSFLAGHLDDKTAVSFSGGKDSLVALDLAYRTGIRKAVFCDTTIEFDETIEYVHEVAEFYNIDMHIVKAPCDFFTLLSRITAPSRRQRWCCEVLKFGPLSVWAYKEGMTAFVTGLRRDESRAREAYSEVDKNPVMQVHQLNPILEWTEKDIWDYIDVYKLPTNRLYEHFSRVGCWCCPFKTSSEWKKIEDLYPEKMQDLRRKLSELADRLCIKDKKKFVDERGWTYWIHSTRKVSVGVNTICRGGTRSDIVIAGNDPIQIQRIADILPILTDNFRIIGTHLRISVDSSEKRRLQILLERALNCVGCGACLSYCSERALYLNDGSIAVDASLCTHCHTCLDASTLKGSCVARHYVPKRASLIEL